MRKKYLIEQNTFLFNQLSGAKAQIESLKKELNESRNEISNLYRQINDEKKNSENAANSIEKEPENAVFEIGKATETDEIVLPQDIEYASSAIGEIVLESARLSNMLTADGETKYMELVNLLLGKTEVAKSEILSVTKETVSIEEKEEKINSIKFNTFEYFNSVMAQK